MGFASKQEQSTSRSINSASGNEAKLLELLSSLSQQAGGQFGDLSQLASGQVGGPTAADQQLVEQSIGASTDAAKMNLDRTISQLMSQLDEQLAARGIQGSSIEAVNRGQVFSQGVNSIGNLLAQQAQQGSQALMQLPFQRAGVQLGANNALLQRLSGLSSPVLGAGLQERLATISSNTTQKSTPGALDFAQLGLSLANPASAAGK